VGQVRTSTEGKDDVRRAIPASDEPRRTSVRVAVKSVGQPFCVETISGQSDKRGRTEKREPPRSRVLRMSVRPARGTCVSCRPKTRPTSASPRSPFAIRANQQKPARTRGSSAQRRACGGGGGIFGQYPSRSFGWVRPGYARGGRRGTCRSLRSDRCSSGARPGGRSPASHPRRKMPEPSRPVAIMVQRGRLVSGPAATGSKHARPGTHLVAVALIRALDIIRKRLGAFPVMETRRADDDIALAGDVGCELVVMATAGGGVRTRSARI
jgi:hypothetical protein